MSDPRIPELGVQIILNARGRLPPLLMDMIRKLHEKGIDLDLLANTGLDWFYQPEPFDGTMVVFTGNVWITPVVELIDQLKRREVPHQIFCNHLMPFAERALLLPKEVDEDNEEALPNVGDLQILTTILKRKDIDAQIAAERSQLDDLDDEDSAEKIAAAKEVLAGALDFES